MSFRRAFLGFSSIGDGVKKFGMQVRKIGDGMKKFGMQVRKTGDGVKKFGMQVKKSGCRTLYQMANVLSQFTIRGPVLEEQGRAVHGDFWEAGKKE